MSLKQIAVFGDYGSKKVEGVSYKKCSDLLTVAFRHLGAPELPNKRKGGYHYFDISALGCGLHHGFVIITLDDGEVMKLHALLMDYLKSTKQEYLSKWVQLDPDPKNLVR